MKKILLLMAAVLAVGITAHATDGDVIEFGDFICKVLSEKEKTAVITGYNGQPIGELVLPSSVNKSTGWSYAVTAIGSSAFRNCTGLTSITIPNSVTAIGTAAFSNCSNLTKILVEEGNTAYTSIEGVLFSNEKTTLVAYPAAKAPDYEIPNSVTAIGNYAFYRCIGLTSITIPNSVTAIGRSAFANCTGLTSITIPNSVTAISEYAFSNCTAVNTIYCYAINPPISGSSNSVFQAVDISKVVLHVVKGADAAYQEADPWKDFIILADLEAQSGIEGIEADGSNAPAEFFNLNGVRVANPENGLYIKRQGGKTAKVLVK